MKKFLVVLLGACILTALLPSAADARWARGRSNINTDGIDVALCEDTITLGSETLYEKTSYVTDFGAPPTSASTRSDTIELFSSPSSTTAVLSAAITLEYAPDLDTTNSFGFYGEATLPTPAGFGDGDTLYAKGFDENLMPITPALIIGDPIYGCDEVVEPVELNMNVWTWQSRIYLNKWFPYVIAFDVANVDTSTLQVSVDNGGTTNAPYYGNWGSRGFTSFYPGAIGVTCDSTQLTLTATSNDGDPMTSTYNIDPRGPGCWW